MKQKIATKSYNMDSALVQFHFTDGKVISLDVTKLNDETKLSAMYHGLSQKCGDSYAGEKDVKKAQDKLLRVIQSLESNTWRMARSASESVAEVSKESGIAFANILMNTALYPQMDMMEAKAKLVELGIPDKFHEPTLASMKDAGYFNAENFETPMASILNGADQPKPEDTISRLRREAEEQA